MSVDIYCNGQFHKLSDVPLYKDEICFVTDISCSKEKNKIILYIGDPRTNIDSLLYCSEFFFNKDINDDTLGQMESKMLVNYNTLQSFQKNYYCKIFFLTKGTTIINIRIEMPEQNRTFMRELIYSKKKLFNDYCYICYENKENIINLHNNHNFCFDCILKLKHKKCPICRQDID